MSTNSSTTAHAHSAPFITRHKKSQAAVEFALSIPILLAIIFGIIDFSMFFGAWLSLENITRQSVRVASTGEYDLADCVDGSDPGSEACGGSGKNAEVDAARLVKIHNIADSFRILIFADTTAPQLGPQSGYFNVVVCSSRLSDPTNPSSQMYMVQSPKMGGMTAGDYGACYNVGTTTQTQDAGGPGYRVIVMADYNHPYITPFMNLLAKYFHLASSREAVVEKFRLSSPVTIPPQILHVPPTPGGPTSSPTATSTQKPTSTITLTATNTKTPTNTPTPTFTATPTFTPTPTLTPTATKSPTPTITPTPSISATPTMTPTITKTPTITRTPTITWTPACSMSGGITTTDLYFHQNVATYDCMYGCDSSPYLKQASSYFLAGDYHWTVEIVGGTYNGDIINTGSFTLYDDTTFVGPRANPLGNDVIEPLGLGLTNVNGSKFDTDQVVKVTMYQQTNTHTCVAKTDNFKVLAAFPSPTPTATHSPTATRSLTPTPTFTLTPTMSLTPTTTWTPRPTFTRTITPTPTRRKE